MTGRAGLALAALLLLATGCGGSPGPEPSGVPSGSDGSAATRDPSISIGPLQDLCDRTARVGRELDQMGRVPLRETNRQKIQAELDEVNAALQGLRAADAGDQEDVLEEPMEAVVAGVRELALAVEDFRTTPRIADGAEHVERSMRQLDRALRDLRRAASCRS